MSTPASAECPQHVVVDLAFAAALRRHQPLARPQGAGELAFGLCLNPDGAWEKYPAPPVDGSAVEEIAEVDIPVTYNAHAPDGSIVRTLTSFALYGPDGRMVGVEALELPNFPVTLYGTLLVPLPPDLAGPLHTPPPPPSDRSFADPVTQAVYGVPKPAEVLESSRDLNAPAETQQLESEYAKSRRNIVALLESLLTMPVSKDAIKDTGIGKSVNKLKDHFDSEIARRSKQIKDGWISLLEKGGAAQAVDVQALTQAVEELGVFFELSEAEAKKSKPFGQPAVKRVKTTTTTLSSPQPSQSGAGGTPAGGEPESNIVHAFEFDGHSVLPQGMHAAKLESLMSYLRILLECDNDDLAGWRLEVHRRQWGATMGSLDYFYYSPDGRRFRCKADIAKAVVGLKKPAPMTTRSSHKDAIRHLPEDMPGRPQVPAFEVTVVPSAKPLPDLYVAPPADKVETLAESIASLQSVTGPRVKIDKLTGWSIALDKERKALYVHSANAVYQLAGSRSLAAPAPEYRSLFLKAWLLYDACRRVAQVLVDYCGDTVPAAKLTLEEVMGRVVSRPERCPGLVLGANGQAVDSEIVVPADSLSAGHYYFPGADKVSADLVAAHFLTVLNTCEAQLDKQLARSGAKLSRNEYNETPFARDLRALGKRRMHLVDVAIKQDKQEDDRRKTEEAKRHLRDVNRDKDRVKLLYKRLEDEGSALLPDDLLLLKGLSVEQLVAGITDKPSQQAVSKYVTLVQPPRAVAPQPVYLPWDPVVFEVDELLKTVPKATVADLPGLAKALPPSSVAPLGPPPKMTFPAERTERAMLTGAVTESCAILELDATASNELGDSFARMLAVWDGACQACVLNRRDPDAIVGSFSAFRRSFVRDGASKTMVALLTMLAQTAAPVSAAALDDDEDDVPAAVAAGAGSAGNAQQAAGGSVLTSAQGVPDEGSGAYDVAMLWPPPDFLVDQCTFSVVLKAALFFYLRADPELAVEDALEAGEVRQLNDGHDAGAVLRALVARPVDAEGACDDVIRQLLADPEAEVFFHPVDKAQFPDYNDKIARPIDLGMIRRRIAEGHYDASRKPVPDAYTTQKHAAAADRVLKAQRSVIKESKEGAESDDEAEDEDMAESEEHRERMRLNQLAEILCDRRTRGKDKSMDCGECVYCLDKPKFGGYNVLKQVCVDKQEVYMNRKQAAKAKGTNAWKRRQAQVAKDEAITAYDEEVYYRSDSLGAGHEGIAADVRCVFRNCHTYNKGTTPIYRTATSLLRVFGQNYLVSVVGRDPKYAQPRVCGFSDFVKEQKLAFNDAHAIADDGGAPARFRRGYPSVLEAARQLDEARDFATLALPARLVVAEWLVNRNIEAFAVDKPVDPKEAKQASESAGGGGGGGGGGGAGKEAVRDMADYFVGADRFHRRLWCSPRFIQETGWVMIEDTRTGRWGFFDEPKQLDKLYESLDMRGRRENQLKRRLSEKLADAKAALASVAGECKSAVTNVDLAAKELDKAIKEYDRLSPQLLDLKQAAEASRKAMLAKAEAEFNLKEAERLKEFELKKGKWQTSQNEAGKPYYFHVDTRETTWKRPLDLDAVWIKRYFVPPTLPTKEESEFQVLERKIAEAKTLIAKRTKDMDKAKSVVVRERVVTAMAIAGKVQPKARTEDWARDGLQMRIARLCAAVLTIEHFAASEHASPVVACGYEAWRRTAERPHWRTTLRQLVSKDAGAAPDVRHDAVVQALIPVLEKLMSVICDGPTPPAQNRDMTRVHAIVKMHQWRWVRALKAAKTMGTMALLVAQLRHMVILDKHTEAAAAWEDETLRGFV